MFQVRDLAKVIVLCSWARHSTLTVPLSTQEYKWVPTNCWDDLSQFVGEACGGQTSPPGGMGGRGGEYEASRFMPRKRNWIELSKCQSYEPVGLNKKLFFSKEETEGNN